MSPPYLQWSLNRIDKGIGGAAIVNDTQPPGGTGIGNATPDVDRVVYIAPSPLNQQDSGSPQVSFWALDGTTISGTLWVLEESSKTWMQVTAATAATPAVPGLVSVPRLTFARCFVEWTANTAVVHAGWVYRA